MSHLPSQLSRSPRLRPAVQVGLALGLSLALWLALGWGLAGAGPARGIPLQGPCDVGVTNDHDDGPGSLRQAIADACPGGRITFTADTTIYLTSTLSITKELTVDGETHAVTISGDSGGDGTPNVRVFYIGSSGVVTLTHLSVVSGTTPSGNGGGIYNDGGTLTVQNSTIAGNSAAYGGGIANRGTLSVQASTLAGNSATTSGGGIYSVAGTLAVQNSTLAGNSAAWGGGIISWATLTVQNSTIAGNSATTDGGGIRNAGTLALSNTLIAGSSAGGDCRNASGGSITADDHNLVQGAGGNACGLTDGMNGDRIGVDPLLGPLGDYGGGTWTQVLLPGSPALDAGNNATCLATDQRGVLRPQGTACDIGALEADARMAVLGSGQIIADGDAVPSAADGTDFGSLALGQALTHTFTISSGGTADLALTGAPAVAFAGPAALDFSLVVSPGTPIGPNAATAFQVRFAPSAAGARVATVTIASSDPAHNPYTFAVRGTACGNALSVTSDQDDGPGSLRRAIADVCPGGRITFAADATIYLASTLSIDKRLTVDGAAHAVKISGDSGGNGTPNVQVFYIASSGVATLTHLSIVSGTTPSGFGGGIYNDGGTLTVQASSLAGNSAFLGGGIYNNGGTLSVQASTLAGNSATNGGGINNNYGTMSVQNSTIAGNSAPAGGGIYNSATLTVQNSTLAGNSAPAPFGTGGGIFNWGTLALYNTLIAGSPFGGDCRNFLGGSVSAADHNLVQSTGGDACGLTDGMNGNRIGVDPRLGPLGDYDGPTQTRALLPGSPALDAGNNATCLDADQRGVLRPQGAACDIGAFEFRPPGPALAVLGGGQVIADGDATPSAADGTDFGNLGVGQALSHTFTISNAGAEYLILTGTPAVSISGPAALDFSLAVSPTTPVAPNAATPFQVRFAPSAFGTRVATITIAGSDPAHNPYTFAVGGTACSGSALSVTSDQDDGPGSLRRAIADVCPGGRITFAADTTIYLASTLSIDKRLTIDGETHAVKVSGDSGGDGTRNVRVFYIGSSGVATLTHLSIVSGTDYYNGGGIHNAGTLTVQASSLAGNSVTGISSLGGGIYNYNGTLSVQASALSSNSAGYGGGIYSEGGTLSVQDSSLTGNSAGSWGWGGGIRNYVGVLSVQNSSLAGNSAYVGGGIYNEGPLTVQASTLAGNSADDGGGIYNYNGTLSVQNSSLAGNSATWDGGGIYNTYRGTLSVQNSTLAGNSATTGGGILNAGTLALSNTLIAGSLSGGDCNNWGGISANDHNLIADGNCSPALSGDPRLGPLGSYGGPTQTYALLPGSPALDAGNDATCLGADQRGVLRPQGAACDIGAFESRGFGLALAGGDHQSTRIDTAFAQPLSVTASSAYGEPVGPGGVIGFSAPAAGASLNPAVLTATTGAAGAVSVAATANGLGGSYAVTATATGVLTPVTFSLTNLTPGLDVRPTGGLTTTEAGGTASFVVRLTSPPTAGVTVSLVSADTDEGAPSPTALTFTPAAWDTGQAVTVTGVDDLLADGDVAYTVQASAASDDGAYNGLAPVSVALTNLDDDTAGYTFTDNAFSLAEGSARTITVSLGTQPMAAVTITLASSDASECSVAPAWVTLDAATWQSGVSFTVGGVQDGVVDGAQPCSIVTGVSSDDGVYAGLDPADIDLTVTERAVFLPMIVKNSR